MTNFNKKLLNTEVEALTPEHGAEILAFYKSHGFDTSNFSGKSCRLKGDNVRYYGVDSDVIFAVRSYTENRKAYPTTLEQLIEMLKKEVKDEFPKEMMVYDTEILPKLKRFVHFKDEKRGGFWYSNDKSDPTQLTYCKFADDIEQEKIELTKDDLKELVCDIIKALTPTDTNNPMPNFAENMFIKGAVHDFFTKKMKK